MCHVGVEWKRVRAIHAAVTALFETFRLSGDQDLNRRDTACIQDLPDALSNVDRALRRRGGREASEAAHLEFCRVWRHNVVSPRANAPLQPRT